MDNPQAYFLSPFFLMGRLIGYERVSQTERVSVNNDGLINRNWLKVQSGLSGNAEELSRISGGALGEDGKPKADGCRVSCMDTDLDKHCNPYPVLC